MAITSSAAVVIALHAEHEARVATCSAVMPAFHTSGATVSEMREYAGCVDLLYPDPVSAETIILFKVLFVIALIGMVVGVFVSRRDSYSTWVDHCLMSVLGFVLLPSAAASVAGIVYGIKWLLT